MTIDAVRAICRALPDVTEDVKWGHDLCFCVQRRMFTVVSLEPPHSIAFKCTPERFGELVERPGIVPAPYMARNMWVQEQELGDVLDRRELETLVKASYDLVVAKLPKSKRPGAQPARRSSSAPRPARPGTAPPRTKTAARRPTRSKKRA
jgi:predicted DNA-binding protein (MmcQ/YjbR family)